MQVNPQQRIEFLVKKGLRARLQTGSLVTGQLFVDLDIFPDAEPANIVKSGRYPQLPTLPTSLQSMLANVNRILNELERSDLEGTLANLNELMASVNSLASSLERDVPGLTRELGSTLRAANNTLAAIETTASADGEIGGQLQDALRELSAAARSIRVMAEYLERHPEAMLRGKSGNP